MKIKKQKVQTKCVIKRKLKFENYKNCLQATKLESKINYLKINKASIKIDHKEFIKNNKLILKTQQRLKKESHNVFTEEINKIALSSNDDKRMKSIDSIETFSYGTSKNSVNENKEIKCSSIIKRCKNN